PDARVPCALARAGVVLLRVPERAAICRVDGHHTVIAPASGRVGLRAGSGGHTAFALCDRAERIPGKTAGKPDRGRQSNPRYTEAERKIAGGIHGGAAHPAMIAVRCVGSLLIDDRRRSDVAKL